MPAAVFDLDGTVVDSTVAMTTAIRAGCAATGVAIADDVDLSWAIGPRVEDSLTTLVGADLMTEARAAFREEYRRSGPGLSMPMPGIERALYSLRRRGVVTAIATYKPEPLAVMILQALGLHELFDAICGRRLDREDTQPKAQILEAALRSLGVEKTEAVFFGDHDEDAKAARELGVAFVRYEPGIDWRRILSTLSSERWGTTTRLPALMAGSTSEDGAENL